MDQYDTLYSVSGGNLGALVAAVFRLTWKRRRRKVFVSSNALSVFNRWRKATANDCLEHSLGSARGRGDCTVKKQGKRIRGHLLLARLSLFEFQVFQKRPFAGACVCGVRLCICVRVTSVTAALRQRDDGESGDVSSKEWW
jgi:hypothetical protein